MHKVGTCTYLYSAQCIVYLSSHCPTPHAQLWPVQSGSRVAVFQVGKDCQLLYSPHGTFTFNLDEEGGAVSKERKAIHNERGIRETVLLLCPDGQLVTFGVPFPLLTR